jgi:anti-sigma B factor antagonist
MADAPYHHILVNEVDDIAVVHFRDQRILEEVRIQELGRELLRLIEVDGRRKLVLDKRLKPLDGRLKFCSIRPEIFEVFAIAKLDRQFKIYPEEADALAAFDDS